MKAASNITDGSLLDLNKIVHWLFQRVATSPSCMLVPMKIRYVIGFKLQPYERALLLRDDVPLKPAGVGYDVYQVIPSTLGDSPVPADEISITAYFSGMEAL